MIIREAKIKDISEMARVHVNTWRIAYRGILPDDILENLSYEKREHSWRQVFKNAQKDGNFTYIAEDGSGQIFGFANAGMERLDHQLYQGKLNAIYILKSYQSKGIGRELVRVVAERLSQIEIHSMLVWVLADNPACRFYEKLGGKKVNQKGGSLCIRLRYGAVI